jgi:hypothetical protein
MDVSFVAWFASRPASIFLALTEFVATVSKAIYVVSKDGIVMNNGERSACHSISGTALAFSLGRVKSTTKTAKTVDIYGHIYIYIYLFALYKGPYE